MQFSKSLYLKHDTPIKNLTKQFFKQFGYEIIDDGEHYGDYDFQIRDNAKIVYSVEVEQKTGWKTYTFPFRTMDVAGRKSKSKADWFIQVNNTQNSLNICPMSIVHSSKQSRKDTMYSQQELFYNVELSKVDNYVYNENEKKWKCLTTPQYLL